MKVVIRVLDNGYRPIDEAKVILAEPEYKGKSIPEDKILARGSTNNRGCFIADVETYHPMVRVRKVPYVGQDMVYDLSLHPPHVIDVIMRMDGAWAGKKKYAHLYPVMDSKSDMYYEDGCEEWSEEDE